MRRAPVTVITIVTAIVLSLFLVVWRYPNTTMVSKPQIVFDMLSESLTSRNILGNISDIILDNTRSQNLTDILRRRYGPIPYSGVVSMDTTLTTLEQNAYSTCVRNADHDRDKKGGAFWDVHEIRRNHHVYLKGKQDAVMLEIGGNIGDDAETFERLYNPRYIILEPLEAFYNNLTKKFRNNPKVTVLNLGLGKKNEVIFVNIEGDNACATSIFSQAEGKTPLFLANATEFFLKVGVGLFDVDLITLNCEGCEYDVMEMIVESSLVTHFRNIQWATHSTLPGLVRPHERYCRIQQLLARTHRPTYQYPWIWESWRRKDIE